MTYTISIAGGILQGASPKARLWVNPIFDRCLSPHHCAGR